VGTCDLEPLLEIDPLTALPDVARFTNLFGGNCAGLLPGFDKIGAADPWENVSEGESGPILDLGLLLCDMGIVDNRLIHDPLDEIESLLVSSPVYS
jgi:hypothetical protein